jgi:hypothetical protein
VLVRSKPDRNHGKGLAIAALIVAGAWLVVGISAVVLGMLGDLTGDAERDESGAVSEKSDQSVLRIRAGDCFNTPALGEDGTDVATVTAVPCAEPHDFEAYKVFDLTGEEYPGDDRSNQLAAEGCLAAFHDFVGLPYGRSELEPYYFAPRSRTWDLFDDRGVTCFIGRPGEQSTGTLRGSSE